MELETQNQALLRAQEQLHLQGTALQSVANAVIMTDRTGAILWANPAFTKLTGYTAADIIGKTPRILKSGRHEPAFYKNLWKTILSGQTWSGEFVNRRKDGSIFYDEHTITPVRSDSGKITHFIGIMHDVTERKQAEESLRLFRTLVDQSNDTFEVIDPKTGRFLDVTDKGPAELGYTREEYLSLRISDIELTIKESTWPQHVEKIRAAGSLTGEGQHRRKDGTTFPIEFNAKWVRLDRDYIVTVVRDITERRQAEEQRDRLAALVEASPDFVGFADPKTTQIRYINKHGRKMCGIGEDEDIGKLKISDVHPAWMNKRIAEIIVPAALRDGLWEGEGAFLHRSGREIPVLMSLLVRKAANGEVDIFYAVSRDITDRKQAEEAMQASEERYRALFESNPNPMWVYDLETLAFLAVNAAAVRHYGYSQDEFLAMTIKDIRPTEDIPALMDDLAQKNDDLNHSKRWRHCMKDRKLIDVEITSQELTWLGRRAKVVLINDITDRKVAEDRVREQADMLNRAQDAIMALNFEDHRITFWNDGAERLYGWTAEEAIGQPVIELIYTEAKEREELLRTLTATGEFRGELKQMTKDRREIIVAGRSTIVSNLNGTPRSILSINTDVTEQKKLEMQLLRAQRLESIGTLAGGVAHDLNNILTPILMCSEMLQNEKTARDPAPLVALIEDSARRGAAIVKQVLTFARGVEGERVTINPRHLLEEIIDIARKTFPKAIEIRGHYPKDLGSIEGDPTQLHQVLLNLSVNARDAMMPAGGQIVVRAENLVVDENYAAMTPGAKQGPHVVIQVSDTGTGMTRATIDKIFDPFFTTKEVGKGTGLGLSTALGIVQSHGGFISVYSEVGKGTTFKVYLPVTMNEDAMQKSETSKTHIQGNNENILVVDDEASILNVTARILENNKYRVMSAANGPEALALFAPQMGSINLVLTDMSMPYMDGVALVRALKKMRPELSIIASTGQSEEFGMAELRSLGVKNFLSKPYNTEKLLTAVNDAVNGRESESSEPADTLSHS